MDDKSWSEKMKDTWWSIRRNRGARILGIVLLLLLATLGVLYGVLTYYGRLPWNQSTTLAEDTNVNSVVTDAATADLPANTASDHFPIAVMIENLVDIRPQAGLSSAGLVYEALVEGGITRFMAVYTTTDTIEKIGPIRSARHYFVDWSEEYGGIYAYVGGSPQALGVTGSSDYITDLNQFYNAQYYYRADDVIPPHNLFSSSELFDYALRDLNLANTTGDYRAYVFKQPLPPEERPGAVAPITINYSSADYQVEWRYDEATNQYLRWNGGSAHTDANTEEQLSASNIAVQRVPTTLLEAATGRLDLETIGAGDALLFQDGAAIVGTWKKPQRGDRTLFYDSAGNEWLLNPGQTWVEVVSTDTAVTY